MYLYIYIIYIYIYTWDYTYTQICVSYVHYIWRTYSYHFISILNLYLCMSIYIYIDIHITYFQIFCMETAEGKPHDHLPNCRASQTNPVPSKRHNLAASLYWYSYIHYWLASFVVNLRIPNTIYNFRVNYQTQRTEWCWNLYLAQMYGPVL